MTYFRGTASRKQFSDLAVGRCGLFVISTDFWFNSVPYHILVMWFVVFFVIYFIIVSKCVEDALKREFKYTDDADIS